MRTAQAQRLSSDFNRLWTAYTVSQIGSAVGYGALPLVAILILHSSDLRVSMIAALAGIASAAIAVPLGPFIEFRRKRPVMISADLVCTLNLVSVPIAAAFGFLTYPQLCIVATLQTVCSIVFNAASGAHLKSLVPNKSRITANSRFETTFWVVSSIGTPIGGVLISAFGSTITILVDSASFLLSACGVCSIESREPAPAIRPEHSGRWTDIKAGWQFILGHKQIRSLYFNALIFGGAIVMVGPLIAVLMLRNLGFAPWQYGLALGLPSLGGILGSIIAVRVTRKFGTRTVLLTFGLLRTCWISLILIAGPDAAGLTIIVVSESLLLFCAGVFNPTFVTYRMHATPDHVMSRMSTAWSVSSKTVQPIFIAFGGVLAAAAGVRFAIGCAAVILVLSAVLLPWRSITTAETVSPPAGAPLE